jgi:holliday junction DNA helicase RuvA
MIGRIEGVVADKGPDGVLVDVGGVGYDVSVPMGTLAALPPMGDRTTLWIHTHVREDELRLFGFASRRDRAAFRAMLKVSGVGPKIALAVLGALSGNELARAVDAADTRRLSAIPGIGKKTAERIILELGGKLVATGEEGTAMPGGRLGELASALKNLGFKPGQVERVVAELEPEAGRDVRFEDLLRSALGRLQGGAAR